MITELRPELIVLLFVILIIIAGFFSAAETGILSVNRYKLRHLVKRKHAGALRVSKLLDRPDKFISLVLIGNNFANTLVSVLGGLVAVQLMGDLGVPVATGILTLIILIFSEISPKTFAALYPEKIAFPSSFILRPLLIICSPLIWFLNLFTSLFFKLLGLDSSSKKEDGLDRDELKTVVKEAGALLPKRHQDMLLSILDLEKILVKDIIIPRNEIVGIDIDQDLDFILKQLQSSQHTRLPVYETDIENIVGILHLRNISRLLTLNEIKKEDLLAHIKQPYFIPESANLQTQLLNFQKEKQRIAIVVDEYGDVKGAITLEDILEEIVGEFTTNFSLHNQAIMPQSDGSYYLDGSLHVRQINRTLKWNLPTKGPKTLNGLLMERLESIPDSNLCLQIKDYYIEIIQIKDNVIKTAKIYSKPKI